MITQSEKDPDQKARLAEDKLKDKPSRIKVSI